MPVAIRGLMIIEAPADPITLGLSTFATSLNTLGVAFALRCTLHFEAMLEAKRLGAKLVMCDVTGTVEADGAPVLEQLDHFALSAQTAKLECGLVGARTKPTVMAAVTAGFRFVSGSAVSAPAPSLERVLRYSPKDVFAVGR
jgi:hypothetical protein